MGHIGGKSRTSQEIQQAERKRQKKAAEEHLERDHRRRGQEELVRRVYQRVGEVLKEIAGPDGRPRKIEAATGIDHSTVSGWQKKGKKRQCPDLPNLCRLALRSGASLDWISGFDVPKLRRQRQLVSDLEEQLTEHVAQEVALVLDASPEFVRAAMPVPSTILSEAVNRYLGEVARTLEAKVRHDNDQQHQQVSQRVLTALGYASGPDPAVLIGRLSQRRKATAPAEAMKEYLHRLPAPRLRRDETPAK
jgi:hypothetical protein